MALELSIVYRGPLSSCNYACPYCPFAMRHESPAELEHDRSALARFVAWVISRPPTDRLSILFTPWGEALTRRWYREALIQLSHAPPVRRVAIQTNLSVPPSAWAHEAHPLRLALWTTYHPGQTTRSRFLDHCRQLDGLQLRYSVGMVGLREHLHEAEALRRRLPSSVYLWINAYKSSPSPDGSYYQPDDLRRLEAIDPLFPLNTIRHPSRGKSCRTGRSVIAVDGHGTIRRCHFVPQPIGNLYDPHFTASLIERPCPNDTCGCHIGYVHLDELGLHARYGPGLLERIPLPLPSPSIAPR